MDNDSSKSILLDAFVRLNCLIDELEAELASLPKGYISKKTRKEKASYYLQWREGKTVRSKYIACGNVHIFQELIERRKTVERELRENRKIRERFRKLLVASSILPAGKGEIEPQESYLFRSWRDAGGNDEAPANPRETVISSESGDVLLLAPDD